MKVSEAIQGYKQVYPKRYRDLARIDLALRRSRIDTLELLAEKVQNAPEKLMEIRDIGPARLALIREMLQLYESKAPPGRAANIHSYKLGAGCSAPPSR